jgi:hypothetical protein
LHSGKFNQEVGVESPNSSDYDGKGF